MPLDDLYQESTNRALDAMSLRPASAPTNPRSAWSAPWRALKAAANEVAGSTADVLKAYGAASAMTLEADPIARAAVGDQRVREGAAEGRRQINTGEAMSSDFGNVARSYARDQRPDPVTAGTAERVVFDGVRLIGKLVGSSMVAGPFGIGLAAGEEGLTVADDLKQQGVDFETRAKVGAVSAGFTSASAFLPMVGPSLKATAGLYLAGGPGAFMAQQAATRAILEQADYGALAKQYDPLDPVGLAVSALVPLPFAAYGAARNIRARGSDATPKPEVTPAVAPDTVDATLVHNLTLQADQHQAINAAEAGLQMADEIAAARRPPQNPADAIEVQSGDTAGLANSSDAIRPTRDGAPDAPSEAGQPGTPSESTAAAALDQNRLIDTATPPAAPKADPVQQQVAQRVQALEQQAGDMPVKVDDQGRSSTIRDELARIRREVAEGTDDELGALDADLLRVAAECALGG